MNLNFNHSIRIVMFLPVGFETFNDDGRLICDRPAFSVVATFVNIVDVDGLVLLE